MAIKNKKKSTIAGRSETMEICCSLVAPVACAAAGGRAVIYVSWRPALFRAWWVALNKATTEDSVAKYVSRLTKSVSL